MWRLWVCISYLKKQMDQDSFITHAPSTRSMRSDQRTRLSTNVEGETKELFITKVRVTINGNPVDQVYSIILPIS